MKPNKVRSRLNGRGFGMAQGPAYLKLCFAKPYKSVTSTKSTLLKDAETTP